MSSFSSSYFPVSSRDSFHHAAPSASSLSSPSASSSSSQPRTQHHHAPPLSSHPHPLVSFSRTAQYSQSFAFTTTSASSESPFQVDTTEIALKELHQLPTTTPTFENSDDLSGLESTSSSPSFPFFFPSSDHLPALSFAARPSTSPSLSSSVYPRSSISSQPPSRPSTSSSASFLNSNGFSSYHPRLREERHPHPPLPKHPSFDRRLPSSTSMARSASAPSFNSYSSSPPSASSETSSTRTATQYSSSHPPYPYYSYPHAIHEVSSSFSLEQQQQQQLQPPLPISGWGGYGNGPQESVSFQAWGIEY
jgi:hypothetical protein